MHQTCYDFAADVADVLGTRRFVVEFGGRNVNGGVHQLFRASTYLAIDVLPGDGVDVVADVAEWTPMESLNPDTILCFSVLEHARNPEKIIRNAARVLSSDGILVLTAPCDPWPVHSGIDGEKILHPGEVYSNLDPDVLRGWLSDFRFIDLRFDAQGTIFVIASKQKVVRIPRHAARDVRKDVEDAFRSAGVEVDEDKITHISVAVREQKGGYLEIHGVKHWIRNPEGDVMEDQGLSMGLKLDFACGEHCTPGYEGVDIAPCKGSEIKDEKGNVTGRHPDVRHVHNLLSFPWPFDDESVESIACSHFVEHLPMLFFTAPKNGASSAQSWEECLTPYQVDDTSVELFMKFFSECYRILAPGGEMTIQTPQAHNDRAFQDPSHRRFLVPASYLYLDAEWRRLNGLEHAAYGVECDFPISLAFVQHTFPDGNCSRLRSFPEAASQRAKHEWNFAIDLHAKFKKRPVDVEVAKTTEVPAAASA